MCFILFSSYSQKYRHGTCTAQCRGQFLCSRSRMNPQFCSPLPLTPRFVPVVVRPTVPVWYPSITREQSPVHGVPLFPFGLTPDASFNSQTTIGALDHSKGNENLCSKVLFDSTYSVASYLRICSSFQNCTLLYLF